MGFVWGWKIAREIEVGFLQETVSFRKQKSLDSGTQKNIFA
jgi:hypothetical protein